MAEPPVDPSQVSAIFPDPPPFWRDFTTEKIEQIESLRSRYADQTGLKPSDVLRVPNIPDDLINLQPPAEPAEGTWRLYGEPATVCTCYATHSLRTCQMLTYHGSLTSTYKASKRLA